MDHYSYTKIDTYAGCPLRFERKYIEKRPEPPSEALDRGIQVHDVVAGYVKHCLAMGVQTDLDFLRSVQGTDEVREILETYANTHIIEPGNYVIEEMWKLSMDPHPWTFWGKIDRLRYFEDDVVEIVDNKTDHQIRSEADVKKDEQLRTYAWMASLKYPTADEFHCMIDFVRYGVTREVVYSRSDIPAIEKAIIAKIEVMEADSEHKATPGPACGYCSYTADCNAVTSGAVEVVQTSEEALDAAGQLLAAKARVKSLEALLRPYCSTNGNVVANGMEVGWIPSDGYDYPDVRALQEVLINACLDPAKYFNPNRTELNKLWKSDDYADLLVAVSEATTSTSFKTRKAVAE
ncbi:PD-(D/E)XK nuclease family protein [Candidatus Pacearchaeota archaeon]|jgi:CRISPR/Cas system-associated exonuclease Cas4 (RecB family)|nr:PD-(D/E)XK nuclease family protein [Candidatus Pacearchaeota archaeon]